MLENQMMNSRALDEGKEGPGLKFFDPLRSPDEEMIRLEVELMRKAADVQHGSNIPINHDVTLHKNINLGSLNERRPRQRFKSSSPATSTSGGCGGGKPNIDSFITQNLNGLNEIRSRNLGVTANNISNHPPVPSPFLLAASDPKTVTQKKTFTISDSVREELMDKQSKTASREKSSSNSKNIVMKSNSNNSCDDPLYLPMSEVHKPAPTQPPPPAPRTSQEGGRRHHVLRSTESCITLCSTDSVYARVNKSKKRSASRSSSENFYQSVDISSSSQLEHLR